MAAPREQLPSAGGKASGQGKKRARPLLEPGLPAPPAAADGQQQHQQHQQQQEPSHNKFARALGSVDFLTRERGVQALTRLLQRKTDITESDMAKLWKGLYFCFWHSDKVPVQVSGAGPVQREREGRGSGGDGCCCRVCSGRKRPTTGSWAAHRTLDAACWLC